MKNILEVKIGVIILIYTIILNLISGRIAFSEAFIFMGFIFLLLGYIKYKNIKVYKKGFKVLKPFILIGLALFIFLETLIIGFPKNNNEYSEYLIILGAGIHGEKLSQTLEKRVEKAIKYINSVDKDMYIILSGGKGEDEDISEALAMKRYLVDKGIKEELLILEDKSTNTKENLEFSKKIIEEKENKDIENINITIVTTDFHAFRSNMIAKSLRYKNIKLTTSLSNPFLIPIHFTREALAIVKSYIFDM